MKDSKKNSGGVTGALFIVFLVLKLTGVIDWSWWWVGHFTYLDSGGYCNWFSNHTFNFHFNYGFHR